MPFIKEKQLDPSFTLELVKRDGSVAFTGDMDLGGNKVTGLGSATAGTDLATFQQVQDYAGVLATADKVLTPTVTSGNYSSTGITISATPLEDGYVQVFVNGTKVTVADGDRDAGMCYFSADSGATAKAVANIASGDALYWNGVISGYDLAITDGVDLDYLV